MMCEGTVILPSRDPVLRLPRPGRARPFYAPSDKGFCPPKLLGCSTPPRRCSQSTNYPPPLLISGRLGCLPRALAVANTTQHGAEAVPPSRIRATRRRGSPREPPQTRQVLLERLGMATRKTSPVFVFSQKSSSTLTGAHLEEALSACEHRHDLDGGDEGGTGI